MTSPEKLLELYAEAFREGKSDPRPFLKRAAREDRDELSALIEMFLVRTEPAEWDPEVFEGSLAERVTDRILPEIVVPERGWCEMLPGLRIRQERKREEVETELAEALRAEDEQQREKVADYYHYMERGTIKPEGVSKRVLASLADIYGTTVEALRRAGERTRPAGGSDAVVFARRVGPNAEVDEMASPGESAFTGVSGEPDRIDRLFTEPDYDDIDQ